MNSATRQASRTLSWSILSAGSQLNRGRTPRSSEENRRQDHRGMTDLHTTPNAGRFEVRVTADSHFAWVRTRLSLERTMMSWLRTAVSLIGFGFAIGQCFERDR